MFSWLIMWIHEPFLVIFAAKGPPVQRKPLKHRDYEVDLESRLGKTQVSCCIFIVLFELKVVRELFVLPRFWVLTWFPLVDYFSLPLLSVQLELKCWLEMWFSTQNI